MENLNSAPPTEGRQSDRTDLNSNVRIRFVADAIVGSGQNISDQGVFFLTDKSLPVMVEIDGHEGSVLGELVRVESMGPDQVGIAVKFQPPES